MSIVLLILSIVVILQGAIIVWMLKWMALQKDVNQEIVEIIKNQKEINAAQARFNKSQIEAITATTDIKGCTSTIPQN